MAKRYWLHGSIAVAAVAIGGWLLLAHRAAGPDAHTTPNGAGVSRAAATASESEPGLVAAPQSTGATNDVSREGAAAAVPPRGGLRGTTGTTQPVPAGTSGAELEAVPPQVPAGPTAVRELLEVPGVSSAAATGSEELVAPPAPSAVLPPGSLPERTIDPGPLPQSSSQPELPAPEPEDQGATSTR